MPGRKIRGFKLNLRAKEVQRRAKKTRLDLSTMGLDSETGMSDLLKQFERAIAPSALYFSFPAQGSTLAPVPGLAYSLGLSTLGPDLDAFVEQAALETPPRSQILKIISQLALEEANTFILGLVEEEARDEHCELSPIHYLSESASLKDVVSRLEAHKIGVAVAEDGIFRPIHTNAFSVSWLARAKRPASSKSR